MNKYQIGFIGLTFANLLISYGFFWAFNDFKLSLLVFLFNMWCGAIFMVLSKIDKQITKDKKNVERK